MASAILSHPPLLLSPKTIVKHTKTFNYYGYLRPTLATDAATFLAENVDSAGTDLAVTLQAFLDASHANCVGTAPEKSACWFTIRITDPIYDSAQARWHQDGRMYDCDAHRRDVVRSKYAVTLFGAPTLMLKSNSADFATLRKANEEILWWRRDGSSVDQTQVDDGWYNLQNYLAEVFEEKERLPIQTGQIVQFSWGQEDSPIHSEPVLLGDRVFVCVLFGSEAEIRNMCEMRETVYEERKAT